MDGSANTSAGVVIGDQILVRYLSQKLDPVGKPFLAGQVSQRIFERASTHDPKTRLNIFQGANQEFHSLVVDQPSHKKHRWEAIAKFIRFLAADSHPVRSAPAECQKERRDTSPDTWERTWRFQYGSATVRRCNSRAGRKHGETVHTRCAAPAVRAAPRRSESEQRRECRGSRAAPTIQPADWPDERGSDRHRTFAPRAEKTVQQVRRDIFPSWRRG